MNGMLHQSLRERATTFADEDRRIRDIQAHCLRSVDASDVLDELADSEHYEQLDGLMRAGDAQGIGALFLSVRKAYAERLVLRAMGVVL
jgi:hypothetical protein